MSDEQTGGVGVASGTLLGRLHDLRKYLLIEAVHYEREHERMLNDGQMRTWPRCAKAAVLAAQRRQWMKDLDALLPPNAAAHAKNRREPNSDE